MRGIILTILVVVLAIGGIGFTLYNNKKEIDASKEVVDRSKIPVRVTTYTAQLQAGETSIVLPATLSPKEEARISPIMAGQITSLSIDEGSYVKKNQVVGSIDTKMLAINLKSAQVALSKAEADYTRAKELFEAKAGIELNMINAQNALDNARIQVEQIEQQIANARITSPISGVVMARNVSQGEFANVGTVIATVATISPLKATVFVNETYAYKLSKGQRAAISAPVFPGKSFQGTITFINPKGDDNHNFQVDLEVAPGSDVPLRAGTSVMVSFSDGAKEESLQVPLLAIMKDRAQPYVYVVNGDRVQAKTVVLGQTYQDLVEIQQGLSAGDTVVTSGQINLAEGSLISIVSLKNQQ